MNFDLIQFELIYYHSFSRQHTDSITKFLQVLLITIEEKKS